MNINNNYTFIIFKDINNNKLIFNKSTINSNKKIKKNNIFYNYYKIEISKFSHPFFTGNIKIKKTTGRIDKFNKKYKNYKL
ncbi:MAG: 50S ribosomal protein L31 [Flavobacteriales endosymbiont of Rhyzopertha dominica]